MKLIHIILISLVIYCSSPFALAKDTGTAPTDNAGDEPPKTGNFILQTSQQPGSFISFGENIIDKNQIQLFLMTTDFSGNSTHNLSLTPAILYGITDNFSVFLNLPIDASLQDQPNHSSGLGDAFVQFEYAFYTKNTYSYTDQATIVGNMSVPTGSDTTNPPTGFGAPSFFLGTTFNRTYIKWLFFTSYGALLTTANGNTQFGNQFLYQAGTGRNLFDIENKWIFAWIVEADGQYTAKNKLNGITDNDSGGNTIYITPSLWVSSQRLILQLGLGFPVMQHLFGEQEQNHYLLAANLGWTIH